MVITGSVVGTSELSAAGDWSMVITGSIVETSEPSATGGNTTYNLGLLGH